MKKIFGKSGRYRHSVIQQNNCFLEKGEVENSSSRARMKCSSGWNPEWHYKGGWVCCSTNDFSGIYDLREVV